MARIRSIKPEFWKSDDIAALSWDARLVFIALWSYVDDNGVGRDNAKLIAAELFALEDDPAATIAKVSGILDELARGSRITRYTNDGRAYLYVEKWSQHQKIDRPNKPRYPLPTDEGSAPLTCENLNRRVDVAEPSRNTRDAPSPGAVELGNEGTEEQGIPPTAGASPAPRRDEAQQVLLAETTDPPPEQISVNRRAQQLATGYRERVPLSKFSAVLGIAKQAIKAGYDDRTIGAALERIAAEGRPLTVDVLRVEIEGLPRGSRQKPGGGGPRLDPSQQDYTNVRI